MIGAGARFVGNTLVAAACAAVLACGSLGTPTEPKSESGSSSAGGADSGPIMGAPAPKPTPTPSPDPGASPAASPAPDSAEGANACGKPLPPAVSQWNVKLHLQGSENWVLDSTPLVGPDAAYCASIGFTDGRSFCPVRPEGNPQRTACELYVVGRAADTGRPGPTWSLDGHFCTGKASGCENNGDNQYLLNTYRGGLFKACTSSGVCGELMVER